MNAIGFSPVASENDELDKLREACKRLNFTIRAIKDPAFASATLKALFPASDGPIGIAAALKRCQKSIAGRIPIVRRRIRDQALKL